MRLKSSDHDYEGTAALYVGPSEAEMNAMADCLQPVFSAQPDCQTQSQLMGRTSA